MTTTGCAHDFTEHLQGHGDSFSFSFYFQILFFMICLGIVVFFRNQPAVSTLTITVVSIFLEALPFMLIGALIGGIIEVFVSRDRLARFLPDAPWGAILLAGAIGLVMPVCECAIVPVVRRLFKKGLPLGAGIAFLLGAPIVNPLVGISTAVAYGYRWSIAGERMVLGYVIAVFIGCIINLFLGKRFALSQEALEQGPHSDVECAHHLHLPVSGNPFWHRIRAAIHHSATDFIDIGRFLVFGAFVAGLLQTIVSRNAFSVVNASPSASVLAMMGLAFVLSLCSEADAFIAASFRTSLPFTAQLAFMVLGPMLDIKLILMYFRMFRKRFIITLSCLTCIVVFLCILARGLFFQW